MSAADHAIAAGRTLASKALRRKVATPMCQLLPRSDSLFLSTCRGSSSCWRRGAGAREYSSSAHSCRVLFEQVSKPLGLKVGVPSAVWVNKQEKLKDSSEVLDTSKLAACLETAIGSQPGSSTLSVRSRGT
eukprot:12390103-Heterocapsa_arctica.AAC.1